MFLRCCTYRKVNGCLQDWILHCMGCIKDIGPFAPLLGSHSLLYTFQRMPPGALQTEPLHDSALLSITTKSSCTTRKSSTTGSSCPTQRSCTTRSSSTVRSICPNRISCTARSSCTAQISFMIWGSCTTASEFAHIVAPTLCKRQQKLERVANSGAQRKCLHASKPAPIRMQAIAIRTSEKNSAHSVISKKLNGQMPPTTWPMSVAICTTT